MAAVWCSFVSNLCSLISYSCSLSSYLCYPLYPPHSIYFCKDSLMPPNTPPHFKTLYCYCYPSKNFHLTISFIFHSCSFVFHSCSIRVHSCSFVFHSCSLVLTRVPFVFHSCSLVFIRVHSCSFVFVRVHSCSDLCGVLDMIQCKPSFAGKTSAVPLIVPRTHKESLSEK